MRLTGICQAAVTQEETLGSATYSYGCSARWEGRQRVEVTASDTRADHFLRTSAVQSNQTTSSGYDLLGLRQHIAHPTSPTVPHEQPA